MSDSEELELTTLPGVGPATKQKLNDAGIYTVLDLATAGPMDIAEAADIDMAKAVELNNKARKRLVELNLLGPDFVNAAELLKKRKSIERITTGSKNLDELLGGGIETWAITEFYGEFGAGKCISGETRIPYSNGKDYFIEPIAKLYESYSSINGERSAGDGFIVKPSSLYVIGLDSSFTRASYIYRERARRLLEIRTESGRVLRISRTHKALVKIGSRLAWLPAFMLAQGSKIALPASIECKSSEVNKYFSDLSNKLSFDTVTRIDEIKYCDYVYDIEVPDGHAYVCGNEPTIMHNSQMCHTLCVTVQLPRDQGGLDAGAVYVDTEGTFRPERIEEIAEARGLPSESVLSRITVARAYNSAHQELIVKELGKVISGSNVKLVILDSAVAHYRAEFVGRSTLAERQQRLNRFMHQLLRIAEVYNIAVVVTNQVQAAPDTFFGDPSRPTGGHVVAHTSTYRIYLRKSGKNRIARMVDSPYHAEREVVFVLNERGVDDPPEDTRKK